MLRSIFKSKSDSEKPETLLSAEKEKDVVTQLMLEQKESQYTKSQRFKVYCATWNADDQSEVPPLEEWLHPEPTEDYADLYAIGLQEMALEMNDVLASTSKRQDLWYARIEEALEKSFFTFIQLHKYQIGSMLLVIYVKAPLKRQMTEVKGHSVPTGLISQTVGNKGAAIIRFKWKQTTFCIINSHLAAHTRKLEDRIKDYHMINDNAVFKFDRKYDKTMHIQDHDVVFWFGDLNFRIANVDTNEVKDKINRFEFLDLINYDQLTRQRILKEVFSEYKEGMIFFKPTFKFERSEGGFYNNIRTPAWCDRVLWIGDAVTQLAYRAHHSMFSSDHKPVSALFKVKVKDINKMLRLNIAKEIYAEYESNSMIYIPVAHVVQTDYTFRNMKYLDTQESDIVIVNKGLTPLKFNFYKSPPTYKAYKPWLKIEPKKGKILVDGQASLKLTVDFNPKTIDGWELPEIEDEVMLQILGGSPIYITVRVECLPSFLGRSLDNNFLHNNTFELREDIKKASGFPTALKTMLAYMEDYGIGQDNVFHTLDLMEDLIIYRDLLQKSPTENRLLDGSHHIVAEMLMIYLDALPTPVVPYTFYKQFLKVNDAHHANKLLLKLPPPHHEVFESILDMLRKHIQMAADVDVTSHVFSMVIFKSPKILTVLNVGEEGMHMAHLMKELIEHPEA